MCVHNTKNNRPFLNGCKFSKKKFISYTFYVFIFYTTLFYIKTIVSFARCSTLKNTYYRE